MKTQLMTTTLAAALGLGWGLPALAQAPKVNFPAASPTCTLKQRVGLTDIEIIYSRPGVKDREIFGGLVPYGKVWRTGANAATRISFSTDVKLDGHPVPAGTYELFTIPNEREWTIIINKGTGQWGAFQYDEKQDLLRFQVKPQQRAQAVETFTIGIDNIRDESASLDLLWDKTAVRIKFEVELTSQLVPQIEAVMAAPDGKKPYFQAATFYYNHGLDSQKALKWVNAAVAENEAHYIVHLKAKILARLGDKAAAIAAAKRSKELAIAANDFGFVKLNDDLIASLQ
ncbi:MAG TPA: DUF2911 domain-containing protein [Verrucomicrobiota bacterium]|nr:DUF2911 domain-containing protein [Verrucomicrobiota bacterium]HNT15239.1 DUF2911 domain-containing protein [Verrucomicrobiota bacterium]